LTNDRPDLAGLLEQVRGGSTPALGQLYQHYADPVYQLAYRLTASEADAADVLQDVFVGLPRALRSYREEGKFLAWLKRLTARAALMRLRTNKRRREESLSAAIALANVADTMIVERLTFRKALEKLPESLRAAFVLKEIEGYSHLEVAQLLDTTVAASTMRVARAWKLLRKEIV
jgi:RNA polymerase sigma-70 factor, ECF subfamily